MEEITVSFFKASFYPKHTALSSKSLCWGIMETCRNWEQRLDTAWHLGWGSIGAGMGTDLTPIATKDNLQKRP